MQIKLNRNAKDKVFKNLLQIRKNLVQFYYDLTGQRINPEDISYDTIAKSMVKGKEEDVAFRIGSKYIILFEAQSTWNMRDVIRFATYMFLLFINFAEDHEKEIYESSEEITIPIVEAYVIYTGKRNLPDMVSLNDFFSGPQKSMINAKMKIITSENAKGMVDEYIRFSQLETEYYTNNKRSKNDVIELMDFCIKNNILKNYMLDQKKEVVNLIENFFSEENRIKGLINDAVYEEKQKSKRKLEEKDKLLAENKRTLEEKDKTIAKMQANEIIRLSKLNLSPEKIVEMTDYPMNLVKEVLEKENN